MSRTICAIIVFVICAVGTAAQSTTFTYQGNLQNGGSNANGTYDFQFALFDAASGGSQIGSTVTVSSVTVTNGSFKVDLDFGSQFPGANRFLQISVRQSGGAGYTLLSPRQPVSSSPYAVTSLNSQNLGGFAASQYVLTTDSRLNDTRPPTAGSNNYIQNTTIPQTANFNLDGAGRVSQTMIANQFTSMTNYRIGNSVVLNTLNCSMTLGINADFGGGTCTTAIGNGAGTNSLSGINNLLVGAFSANNFLGGNANTFVGNNTDSSSPGMTGNAITLLGFSSKFGTTSIQNATAIGAYARVDSSDSIVLGSIDGVNGATSSTNVGIGTTSPTQRLQVVGNGVFSGNLGVGTTSPTTKVQVSDNGANVAIGGLGCGFGFAGINFFPTAGSNSCVNYSLLGEGASTYINRPTNGVITFRMANVTQMQLSSDGNLGIGTTTPADRLDVNGAIRVATLGAAGATQLCRNASNQISTCSSSLRYKTNIAPFSVGLEYVRKLRPISFDWKDGGLRDVGFGAEDLAKIDPRFVTYNDKGEVEGVKYDRVGVVLVNAVNEQQQQIESQQRTIESQQRQIDQQKSAIESLTKQLEQLKVMICSANPSAEGCRQ